jgi:hypothetical protein
MNKTLVLLPESVLAALPANLNVNVGSFAGDTAHGSWPTIGEIRQLSSENSCVAVTLNTHAESVHQMLAQLMKDGSVSPSRIICSNEPVPRDLLSALPAVLHSWIRRPQTTDLVQLDLQSITSLPNSTSALEAAVQLQATSVAVAGDLNVDRFPPAGPDQCKVSPKVLNSAFQQTIAALEIRPMEQRCVEAGLWLLWDCLDESHEISQTMEGKGSPRTADYWHGIMHRREPDASNASYWFRRVGDHPAFHQLRDRLEQWMQEIGVPLAHIEIVRSRLLTVKSFDPIAMVEFSTTALKNRGTDEERAFRIVQYLEILNLLAWSCQQAS